MKAQSGKTIDHISKDIEQLFYLKQENQKYIDNALPFDNASQSEIEDRKRLAAEYDKMIQFRNIEREYLKENYLDKYNDKSSFTPQEMLCLYKKLLHVFRVNDITIKDAKISEKHWKEFINSL